MSLRYYQRDAVDACYQFLAANADRNPCIVLPTGAGKTHVIVQLCQDVQRWGGRVLVLAHVKELLQQAAEKLKKHGVDDVGVYSAGLKSRDTESSVLVAGVQSVHRRGLELAGTKPFNLVIVDEAHRIPLDGDGMYQNLLNDLRVANPKLRVVGLTATPYRTGEGMVCRDDHFLNEVCYEADIKELIAGGFLCPLTSKRSQVEVDTSGLRVSRGDFVQADMEQVFNDDEKVKSAVDELLRLTSDRKKVLVFCCGIAHATAVAMGIDAAGQSVRVVTSEHTGRDLAIEAFKAGQSKYLVNVNCLTEGFDETAIDAVILLRATCSPGLYYQMVGRGLRTDPSKENCLVLDFGGNVRRHGTIDQIQPSTKKAGETGGEAPVKACPECDEMVHAALSICPSCGYEFPKPEANHEAASSGDCPLAGPVPEKFPVSSVLYAEHRTKGKPEDAPRSMRVSYFDGLDQHICDEWVCVEHTGFAWEKAHAWWHARSNVPMPDTARDAVSLAQSGALAETTEIIVKDQAGSKFQRIVDYELGEKPTGEVVVEEEEIPW